MDNTSNAAAVSGLATASPGVVAGPTLELVCGHCSYGVIVRRPPPACPMCGRRAWEPPVWRPFSRRQRPADTAA